MLVPRDDATVDLGVAMDAARSDAPATDVPTADRPTCAAGQMNCGGVCVDLQTNAAHCGECAQPCAPLEMCAAGVCVGGGAGPLSVELSWDVPGNVDLQVVTPCGSTISRTIVPVDACGGALDRDDTLALGPENVTFLDARRGTYFVCAVPTALGTLGGGGTTATVRVFLGPSLMSTLMRTYTASDTDVACGPGSRNAVGTFIVP